MYQCLESRLSYKSLYGILFVVVEGLSSSRVLPVLSYYCIIHIQSLFQPVRVVFVTVFRTRLKLQTFPVDLPIIHEVEQCISASLDVDLYFCFLQQSSFSRIIIIWRDKSIGDIHVPCTCPMERSKLANIICSEVSTQVSVPIKKDE